MISKVLPPSPHTSLLLLMVFLRHTLLPLGSWWAPERAETRAGLSLFSTRGLKTLSSASLDTLLSRQLWPVIPPQEDIVPFGGVCSKSDTLAATCAREQPQLWMKKSQLSGMGPVSALLCISHCAGLFLQLNASGDADADSHVSGKGEHFVRFSVNTSRAQKELGVKGRSLIKGR